MVAEAFAEIMNGNPRDFAMLILRTVIGNRYVDD